MNCTHPVLYAKLDGLYCHICGAKLRVDEAVDKQEGQLIKASSGVLFSYPSRPAGR